MEPNTPREASEYWNALGSLLPVVIVGGFAAMVARLKKIKKEPDWKDRLLDLAITGLVGAVVAFVAVAVVPLFYEAASPRVELAIGAVAGSYGLKVFDLIVERVVGRELKKDE